MEEFKGMSRASTRAKTTTNMWQFARNIVLGRSRQSISNEEGFDYKHEIPGTFIGKIETNEEVVYFSVDDSFSYIGIYKTNEIDGDYIPILKSQYLGFKINRPIEGVFWYNYRKELIIAFCDGVFENSNIPKLINLTNIGVELTSDLELVNPEDLIFFQLFAQSIEGLVDIDYTASGTLEADVVYITYSYVLADDISTTVFLPIHEVAYPTHNYRELDRRNIIINLTDLDPNYNQVRIGLVVITDEGLVGYQSDNLSYTDKQLTTIISNLTNYTTINVDELLVGKDVYSRIKTMTFVNDELVIANAVKESEFKFQKFANNLNLELAYDVRPASKYTEPTYCPDEVYSHYIELQRLDGTYTEGFHIPGKKLLDSNEINIMTQADLDALGLKNLNASDNYRRFHIFNKGDFTYSGIIGAGVPVSNNLLLDWGYWQNEETYPLNEEYNGTQDYNGNNISGGEDLRGKNIRYHRMPGMDTLVKKFPSLLGYNNRNTPEQLSGENNVFYGLVPAFSVKITNFDAVVPIEIREQIQGYRLTIVKRKSGERLVEDINFLKQSGKIGLAADGVETGVIDFDLTMYHRMTLSGTETDMRYQGSQFGHSRVRSNQLSIYKPAITAKLIKANYAVRDSLSTVTSNKEGFTEIDATKLDSKGTLGNHIQNRALTNQSFGLIKDTQRFAVIKEVEYKPGNNIAANTLFTEEHVTLIANNSLQPPISRTGFPTLENNWNPLLYTDLDTNSPTTTIDYYDFADRVYKPITTDSALLQIGISATILNLYKNVYSGFRPKEFITVGHTNINNTSRKFRYGGDVFTNNIYNIPVTVDTRGLNDAPNAGLDQIIFNQLFIKGMFSVTNNSEIYIEKDRLYGRFYDMTGEGSNVDVLINFVYELQIFNREVFRSLNDLIIGIAFNIKNKYINYFPYRVARSLKIANENLSTNNVRAFLSNRYKEMLNDRGEVIVVRGTAKILYIQQKFTLMVASIKDRLDTEGQTTYIGNGDIFDREPDEVFEASNKGYIGSTSQFACFVFKFGYCTIDQVKGKIWIVGQGAKEISAKEMDLYFAENSDTSNPYYTLDRFGNKQAVDNPYTQVGHIVGIDEKYRRLLFTKKMYEFIQQEGEFTFDGEYYFKIEEGETIKLDYTDINYFRETSTTFSYQMDRDEFVCQHDYFPKAYVYTNKGLFLIDSPNGENSKTYQHNSKNNKGVFFGVKFESYVDLIFNSRYDLSKLYQAVEWGTEVIAEDGSRKYFKTIDKIMLYNDYQCTGIINIPDNTFKISRNKENVWNFNSFRDMVIDKYLPIIGEEGSINENNINFNKSFFDKSNFIDIFIVVRLIMANDTNDTVYIHRVNVKSRISDK